MRPGDHVGDVALNFYGTHLALRFRAPGDTGVRRARSDQLAVEVDGMWLMMSLRAALLHLAEQAPRVLTRKERA